MTQNVELKILGSGVSGRSRAVNAQKRQNLFLEVKPENDKSDIVAYGTPGLRLFSDFGNEPVRGMWWYELYNLLYVVAYDSLLEINGGGVPTVRGTLDTNTGNVSLADNGLQLMLVDGQQGYIFERTTGPLNYSSTLTKNFITETDHGRSNGDAIEVSGDSNFPSGNYTVDLSPYIINTNLLTIGVRYRITVSGGIDWSVLGANSNEVGTVFSAIATDDGGAPGTAACVTADEWIILFTTGTHTGTLEVVNNFRKISTTVYGTNFPKADTVAFIDSYFVINNHGTKQFWLSGQYNGLYWDPLQFASKEAYTDNLEAVTIDNGQIVLLGSLSTEYWQDNGGYPFPFARISGSPLDVGVAARWSVAHCAGSLLFLARSRRGGYSIVAVNNYTPAAVSTPDLDYLLNSYSTVSDAVAFSYRQAGHEFYQISFPSEGTTWLYDATTGAWSILQSGQQTRHYAQWGTLFNGGVVVSDYRKGLLYWLDPDYYTDNGEHIARELITPHLFSDNSFNKLHIYRLRVDMEQGVGNPL